MRWSLHTTPSSTEQQYSSTGHYRSIDPGPARLSGRQGLPLQREVALAQQRHLYAPSAAAVHASLPPKPRLSSWRRNFSNSLGGTDDGPIIPPRRSKTAGLGCAREPGGATAHAPASNSSRCSRRWARRGGCKGGRKDERASPTPSPCLPPVRPIWIHPGRALCGSLYYLSSAVHASPSSLPAFTQEPAHES